MISHGITPELKKCEPEKFKEWMFSLNVNELKKRPKIWRKRKTESRHSRNAWQYFVRHEAGWVRPHATCLSVRHSLIGKHLPGFHIPLAFLQAACEGSVFSSHHSELRVIVSMFRVTPPHSAFLCAVELIPLIFPLYAVILQSLHKLLSQTTLCWVPVPLVLWHTRHYWIILKDPSILKLISSPIFCNQ